MFHIKYVEKIKTHFVFSNFFFLIVPFEIMWKNTVETDGPQMTIWRKSIACRITKATHKFTVILIALQLQQWLHESASMLRHT